MPLRNAAAVASASAIALLSPTAHALDVGPEVVVAPDAAVEIVQREPQAAFDGEQFFVVWQAGSGDGSDVHAARLTADGEALDLSPIEVSTAPERQRRPAVAASGGVVLVVWEDLRNGTAYDVRAARLDADGLLLDAESILVAGGPDNQARPHVTAGPEGFLVVWQQWVGAGYAPRAARVSTEGVVLDDPPIHLFDPPEGGGVVMCTRPRASFDGTSYLVVWEGEPRRWLHGHYYVTATRLDGDGLPIDPEPFVVLTPQSRVFLPDVAAGPDGWLTIWQDHRDRGELGQDGVAARVAPDGEVLDVQEATIQLGSTRAIYAPSVAWDGEAFTVVFSELADDVPANRRTWSLVARQVTVDGASAGDDVVVDEDVAWPGLARGEDGQVLLVYSRLPVDGSGHMTVAARLLDTTP